MLTFIVLIVTILILLAVLGLYGKPDAEVTIVHTHTKRGHSAKAQKRDKNGRFTA